MNKFPGDDYGNIKAYKSKDQGLYNVTDVHRSMVSNGYKESV